MKKTVIANYGAGDRGKSSSLVLVYQKIVQKYPNIKIIDKDTRWGEIKAIFEINGLKIAIESQGDPDSRIHASLEEFLNINCDVIICACRTKGETTNAVGEMEGKFGYRLIWAQNIYCESISNHVNNIYAESIVTLFDDIINSRI